MRSKLFHIALKLNYNVDCDWLIELSDNNLANELVENRTFFKPITIEEFVIFVIIPLYFFFTYPWRSRHHSVRLEINIQSHLFEDVFKQRNHLQGQHILKSEQETLVTGGTGNEYHLKRARWDFYLSYVITNFEYGGLPINICFVFFTFTVWRWKTCGMSRKRFAINACFNKQMVNAIACTIELWYTREVAKHERSVRVARGDSRVRL